VTVLFFLRIADAVIAIYEKRFVVPFILQKHKTPHAFEKRILDRSIHLNVDSKDLNPFPLQWVLIQPLSSVES
jgi:hypothetical protein